MNPDQSVFAKFAITDERHPSDELPNDRVALGREERVPLFDQPYGRRPELFGAGQFLDHGDLVQFAPDGIPLRHKGVRPVEANDHSVDALRYAVHSTAHEWRHLLTGTTEYAAES
ncbi:hypothetical protein FMM49_19305 [Streptomyces rimosus subsp. rimosus]|nr:hypothetical protein FMM49_19305 [Streptomyces rimosus subsp. rimosus]